MDLAALQNLCKRDPEAYREEFELQRRHFDTQLQIFTLKPHADSDNFESLITFLSHVAPSYPQAMGNFPQQLMDLLEQQASALEPSLRLCIAKVPHLLPLSGLMHGRRSSCCVTATCSPRPPFSPFSSSSSARRTSVRFANRCAASRCFAELRELVYEHIVHDIKRLNLKAKNNQLNRTLQNFMCASLARAPQRD